MEQLYQKELCDILSDSIGVAPALSLWIETAGKRRSSVWDELKRICDASSVPLRSRLRDYQALETHPDTYVCHDTGISTYRCGPFQYTDSTLNNPTANVDGLGAITDFCWWSFFHQQAADYIEQTIKKQKDSEFIFRTKYVGRKGKFEREQMRLIGQAFERYYSILRAYRLQHYRQLLEAMPERRGFADYALRVLRSEALPKDVAVIFPSAQKPYDPHFKVGGSFSVMLLCDGFPYELHECNAIGDSIYRTYFSPVKM